MSDSTRLLEEARLDEIRAQFRRGQSFVTPGGLRHWPALDAFNDLAAEHQRLSTVQRQLDAVDAALPEWEPEPESEVGCVGRVQTILNLKADRAELQRLRQALERISIGIHGRTQDARADERTPTGFKTDWQLARAALAGSTTARQEEGE